jgi:hypothetical protein
MKIFIFSVLFSATSLAANFSKNYNVICDLSRPPVTMSFSELMGTQAVDCVVKDKQVQFTLKEELQVNLGEATYVAPKGSAVFMHSKNSALDKTCESVLANVKSVLFTVSPKSIPSLRYNISLDTEGVAYVSQMQVLMCSGKAE